MGFNNRAVAGKQTLRAEQYNNNVEQMIGQPQTVGTVSEDWGYVIRNDDAEQQEYSLSARGGNETTSFYISGTLFGQEGPVIGSDLDRYSGTVNVSHRFDDRVSIDNSLQGSLDRKSVV